MNRIDAVRRGALVVTLAVGASLSTAAPTAKNKVIADTAGKWVKYNKKSCKYVPIKSRLEVHRE